MEYKSVLSQPKAIEGRSVIGLAAVFGNVDAGGDRIFKGAFRKTIKENGQRVRHLWQHDYSQPPVAAVRDLKEVGVSDLPESITVDYPEATGGLLVTREYLDTPRGNEILDGIRAGAINEMSFGYDPVKMDFEELETPDGKTLVRNLREIRLWDCSDVVWGMNPATVASKMAVPFKDTGRADEGESWSAPTLGDFSEDSWADMSDGEKRRIANHFAWQANSPPETYGDLKLGHHRPAKSGVGPAVWRGVAAAMGALLGARGGVQIPDGDRRGVYSHLVRHYEQWEKEPPDFKLLELSFAIADVTSLKEGRVLSSRNLERLRAALDTLTEILLAAEPQDDDEKVLALTEQLRRRTIAAQYDTYLLGV